nr:hypothetical transcript [Hymenolepis microstoma]
MSNSDSFFSSSQRSVSDCSSLIGRRLQRFRDWKSPNSQTWNHAVDVWNQSLKNEPSRYSNGKASGKNLAPNPGNTTDVKQSFANLSEIADKLSVAADELQNQFNSNENEELFESSSFLNEGEDVRETSSNAKSDALLDSVKVLEEEIRKLPELIENSKRQFEEEIIRYYEEQAEKLLSSAIESCLSICKEKIDELVSFAIEEASET